MLPTETTESRTYTRPERDQNPLNAWSHRCELAAKKTTSALLQGRTIALKDNISVGGLPTTIGAFPQLLSEDEKYSESPIDATVVRRVLEAGAIVKGTATCEIFSACPLSYSSSTGPVHNPYLRSYNAGGSSSGPGALVAAHGLTASNGAVMGETVEMAIGGDQGGSIRLPASYCGIYGLKPTHGLVPYTGTANLFPMVDSIGPMASSVRDIALLLQTIAGYDGFDAKMTAESPLREQVKDYCGVLDTFLSESDGKLGQGLKIGILKQGFAVPNLSPLVQDTVYQAARNHFARAGAEVKDISIPMHAQGPALWTAATRASMADVALAGEGTGYLSFNPPHIKPRWPMDQEFYDLLTATNPAIPNLVIASQYLKSKFGPYVQAKAQRKVYELRAAYDQAFEEVDILITPCTPTVAMPHPKMKLTDPDHQGSSVMDKLNLSVGSTSNTCPFNITGHPAISVPCGWATPGEEGVDIQLPVGMQLIAQRWDEETLLKAAAIFEMEMGKQ